MIIDTSEPTTNSELLIHSATKSKSLSTRGDVGGSEVPSPWDSLAYIAHVKPSVFFLGHLTNITRTTNSFIALPTPKIVVNAATTIVNAEFTMTELLPAFG